MGLVLLGFGLLTLDQVVPFQCTISVRFTSEGVPQLDAQYSPAAQESFAPVALTPYRRLNRVLGLGLVTCDQEVPSQCMIRVRCTSEPTPHPDVQYQPTAQASVGELALTANSWSVNVLGFGLVT
jgi:hypothetical protein